MLSIYGLNIISFFRLKSLDLIGVSAAVETLDPEVNMTLFDSLPDTPLPEVVMQCIISYQAQGRDLEQEYEQIYLLALC